MAEADPEQSSGAAACFRRVQEVALWSPSLTIASGLFLTGAKSKCTQKMKRAFPKQKPCRLNAPLLTCSELFCNNAKDETKLHWRSDITDAPG